MRLGVGVGWNAVAYEALGEDFHTRGIRCEEQIELLRLLWTQEVVTYRGRWHRISHAALNARPIQRPIPVWIGSGAPEKPVPPDGPGRRGGGRSEPGEHRPGRPREPRGHESRRLAGRRASLAGPRRHHLSVSTGGHETHSPQEHLDAIRRFAHVVGL